MTSAISLDEQTERRQGSVWDYVSASRLNLWLKCPLAFKLRYIEGLATPTGPAQFVGQLVHAGLEDFYRHRQFGRNLAAGDVVERLEILWEPRAAEAAVFFGSSAEEHACRSQAGSLFETYLAQLPDDEPKPAAVELTLEAPLIDPETGQELGLPLVGIIDLILPHETGPQIIDFKTAAKGGAPLDLLHELQLSAYAYLIRHGAGETESRLEIRSLIKTKQPRVESHSYRPRTARQLRRFFAVVRSYLDALDRQDFIFRPGLHCAGCEFRERGCASWPG